MHFLRNDVLPVLRQDTDYRSANRPHRNSWRRTANLNRELANVYTPLVIPSSTNKHAVELLERPMTSQINDVSRTIQLPQDDQVIQTFTRTNYSTYENSMFLVFDREQRINVVSSSLIIYSFLTGFYQQLQINQNINFNW